MISINILHHHQHHQNRLCEQLETRNVISTPRREVLSAFLIIRWNEIPGTTGSTNQYCSVILYTMYMKSATDILVRISQINSCLLNSVIGFQCDDDGTIITDGAGLIDIR